MHDLTLIVNLAGALAIALAFGWITQRLGLSTLVGYMVAGIAVGPYTPGFVADVKLAQQMAEIGVILLMFGVGLHFQPRDLLRVRRIALPGAVVQSLVAGAAGWAVARLFGWTTAAGLVFGMSLAVASTVVLTKMLVEQDRLGSHDGHVAVGWLIVEDLFTVVALVLLPALTVQGTDKPVWSEVALALGKGGLFAVLVWAVGTRLLAPVMERIARLRSGELFTLTVFVVALGIALLAAQVFHMSVALGAFFAGLVVGQSRIGPQAAADMTPFRDVFSALFFVSIGMLFDPGLLTASPALLALALGIVLVLKPLAAILIVLVLRDTVRTALTVAVGLAQIGEFSFILAGLGVALGVLESQGRDILVAAAIVSIALNPLLFRWIPAIERFVARRFPVTQSPDGERTPEPPARMPPVILTGLGDLGRRVAQRCLRHRIPFAVIDSRVEELKALKLQGAETVAGDAGSADALDAAGAASARVIIVTNATLPEKMRICSAVRRLNPRIAIIAAADSEAERAWLREFGVAFVSDALDEVGETLVRALRAVL